MSERGITRWTVEAYPSDGTEETTLSTIRYPTNDSNEGVKFYFQRFVALKIAEGYFFEHLLHPLPFYFEEIVLILRFIRSERLVHLVRFINL